MRLYIIRHADPDYANDTITAAPESQWMTMAKAALQNSAISNE